MRKIAPRPFRVVLQQMDMVELLQEIGYVLSALANLPVVESGSFASIPEALHLIASTLDASLPKEFLAVDWQLRDEVSFRKRKQRRQLSLQSVPVELQQHLFSFLDTASLCQLSRVCKYLYHQCIDPALWKHVSFFPHENNVCYETIAAVASRYAGSIQSLDLALCAITDEMLDCISTYCLNITQLNLNMCTLVNDSGLIYLTKLHSLSALGIAKSMVTDEGLLALLNRCTCITELDLSRCYKISDMAINEVATKLSTNLRKLGLDGCDDLSSGCIQNLVSLSTNLEQLRLAYCNVTDATVTRLALCCPRLVGLDLTICNVTDDGVQALCHHCSNLCSLVLTGCDVTGSSVTRLLGLSRLRELHLVGCLQVQRKWLRDHIANGINIFW